MHPQCMVEPVVGVIEKLIDPFQTRGPVSVLGDFFKACLRCAGECDSDAPTARGSIAAMAALWVEWAVRGSEFICVEIRCVRRGVHVWGSGRMLIESKKCRKLKAVCIEYDVRRYSRKWPWEFSLQVK